MTDAPDATPDLGPGIDPDDLATTLRVLAELHTIDNEHPDFVAVRHATAAMFKAVKRVRRKEIRDAIAEADKAVVARTATGAPDRIDDETRGNDLATSVVDAPIAGELLKPRNCYICKQPYTLVDAFYHQLCPDCARFSHGKRTARTDLTGKRALLTGGRAKIGMHIALRLLRDGAHTTITTRFPRDAVRRFSALPDAGDWLHRLRVVGIDLRDPAQVIGLADSVAAQGPLDILINNAAQTVRRSPGAYSLLADAELQPLPDGPLPEMETFGHTVDPHPQALQASVDSHPLLSVAALGARSQSRGTGAHRGRPRTARDGTGLVLAGEARGRHGDRRGRTRAGREPRQQLGAVRGSGRSAGDARGAARQHDRAVPAHQPAAGVDGRVAVAPEVRRERLRDGGTVLPALQGSRPPAHEHGEGRAEHADPYERGEMLETDGILMTAVDTGWITDERPHYTKVRLAEEGFHAPLDLVDGAARVYDPIVRGEAGEDIHGVFLKDYEPSPW